MAGGQLRGQTRVLSSDPRQRRNAARLANLADTIVGGILSIDNNGRITLDVGTGGGLAVDGNGDLIIDLADTPGLEIAATGLQVKAADGIELDADGVNVALTSVNPGLQINSDGDLTLKIDSSSALYRNSNGLSLPIGDGLTLASALVPDSAARYALDDGSGSTAADSSGNGNDGTLNSSPPWDVGDFPAAATWLSGSLEFQAFDDAVVLGQPTEINWDPSSDDLTIMTWFKATTANDGHLISKGDADRQFAIYLRALPTGGIGLSISDEFVTTPTASALSSTYGINVLDGAWHHVAVSVADSGGSRGYTLYIDGTSVQTGTFTGTHTNAIDWLFGARRDTANTGFVQELTGNMADVRFYASALSATTINGFVDGAAPGLVADLEVDLSAAASMEFSSGDLQLVNDNATPGNTYYYGTNGSGTKGWYTLTSGTVTTFLGLSDTPGSYNANRVFHTNSAGNAVESTQRLQIGTTDVQVGNGVDTDFGLYNASGTVWARFDAGQEALYLLAASNPIIYLAESTTSTGFFSFQFTGPTQSRMSHTNNGAGTALIDFDPEPSDGTSSASFRFFRSTNTTGAVGFTVFAGNGTGTANHFFGGNQSSYLCANTAGLTIGSTASAAGMLDVRGNVNMQTDLRLRTSGDFTNASRGLHIHGDTFSAENYIRGYTGNTNFRVETHSTASGQTRAQMLLSSRSSGSHITFKVNDSGAVSDEYLTIKPTEIVINENGRDLDFRVEDDNGSNLFILLGDTTPEVGFFGSSSTRPAAYTPTNVVSDRSYDADATSVAELADVLGTLIADLQGYGLLQ